MFTPVILATSFNWVCVCDGHTECAASLGWRNTRAGTRGPPASQPEQAPSQARLPNLADEDESGVWERQVRLAQSYTSPHPESR